MDGWLAIFRSADAAAKGDDASDLMVGILFVFLLMLTVFALNFREEEDKQKIEYSKYVTLQKEAEEEKKIAVEEKNRADDEKKRADE